MSPSVTLVKRVLCHQHTSRFLMSAFSNRSVLVLHKHSTSLGIVLLIVTVTAAGNSHCCAASVCLASTSSISQSSSLLYPNSKRYTLPSKSVSLTLMYKVRLMDCFCTTLLVISRKLQIFQNNPPSFLTLQWGRNT